MGRFSCQEKIAGVKRYPALGAALREPASQITKVRYDLEGTAFRDQELIYQRAPGGCE